MFDGAMTGARRISALGVRVGSTFRCCKTGAHLARWLALLSHGAGPKIRTEELGLCSVFCRLGRRAESRELPRRTCVQVDLLCFHFQAVSSS